MSGHRRATLILVIAAIVGGCTLVPASTPGPSTSPASLTASAEPSPTPAAEASAAPRCPTSSPLVPSAFLEADPACFAGHDVVLTGWAAGSLAPADEGAVTVKPAWLWAATASLYDRPSMAQRLATSGAAAVASVRLAVQPGTAFDLPATPAWVEVSGHRDDPAALTCIDATGGGTIHTIDECRAIFVVTGIHAVAGTRAPCPTTSPLSVMAYLRSDPACFPDGVDVTLVGWQDVIDGLCGCVGGQPAQPAPTWLTGIYPQGGWLMPDPTVVHWNSEPAIPLRARPSVGLAWPKAPAWVQVTGHLGDPDAAACPAEYGCASLFVVTSLSVLPVPSRALWFCPAIPVPVDALAPDVAAVCWHGRSITILGWYDPHPQLGEPTFVFTPTWLDPAFAPTLDGQPDAAGMGLFVKPGSGVDLGTLARWVAVTGHFGDPAAATCRATNTSDGSLVTDDWAQRDCSLRFVVTSIGEYLDHPTLP